MVNTHDGAGDTAGVRAAYERPDCGAIVTAETHPGECAMCGKPFQTRATTVD